MSIQVGKKTLETKQKQMEHCISYLEWDGTTVPGKRNTRYFEVYVASSAVNLTLLCRNRNY